METEKTINMGNCEIQKINSLEKFLSDLFRSTTFPVMMNDFNEICSYSVSCKGKVGNTRQDIKLHTLFFL